MEVCETVPGDGGLEGLHDQPEPNERIVAVTAGDERVAPGAGRTAMRGVGRGARARNLNR